MGKFWRGLALRSGAAPPTEEGEFQPLGELILRLNIR